MKRWPKPKPITCGQIRQLLGELGCTQGRMNARYDVFREPQTDMIYPLPRWADDTPAPDTKISELRAQLYWRGLMERAEFDAYFARMGSVQV